MKKLRLVSLTLVVILAIMAIPSSSASTAAIAEQQEKLAERQKKMEADRAKVLVTAAELGVDISELMCVFNLETDEMEVRTIDSIMTEAKARNGGVLPDDGPIYPDGYETEVINPAVKSVSISPLNIGVDNRTQVTNTTAWPYRAIVHLQADFQLTSSQGTGFMLSNNKVVTAAHVVYSYARREYCYSVTAVPGRNGSSSPYGSYTGVTIYIGSAFVISEDPNYDYAVIELNTNVNSSVGSLGISVLNDSGVLNSNPMISGYPLDKGNGTTQWQTTGSVHDVSPTRLFHSVYTTGGQSGAPIISVGGSVIGMHRGTYNSVLKDGTRINQTVYNIFMSLR